MTGTMSEDRTGRTSEEARASESTLPLETVFRALANRRRRTVLYHLTTCTRPVPFRELVDAVASEESDSHSGDVPADVYEAVAVDLHHTQLPKLAEWGIVDYETDAKLVTVAETLRPLDEFLRLAEQHDHQRGKSNDRS